MTFSRAWNDVYASGREQIKWPWSDVVSLVTRHCGNIAHKDVLELGCGSGANIPFFVSAGANYHGIEGSHIACDELKEKYTPFQARLACKDFTEQQPFYSKFHLIFDRGAVTHNDVVAMQSSLDIAYESLLKGGIYIGVDWFSTKHDGAAQSYLTGRFEGVGTVTFLDEEQIRRLFSKFELIHLEEKVNRSLVGQTAMWNIVGKKCD